MSAMLTTIRYIMITALRDRLFIGLLGGVLVITLVSAMLGGTAFIEEKEMTITYAAGAARLLLMIGMIVFVCFHIRSAFDSKEIDVILSRPVSRLNLIIAYWLGFSFVALLLTLPIVAIIALIGIPSLSGYLGWAASLILELGLVMALSLFTSFAQKSAVTSVLSCLGFYVLSRMMAFFVVTAESGLIDGKQYQVMKYVLWFISTVVPRLDLFSKTEWLIYGFNSSQEWLIFVAQTVIFVPLLLLATIADFRRKQF